VTRAALAVAAALLVAVPAARAAAPTAPVYDARGRLIQTPYAPTATAAAKLTSKKAADIFLHDPKVVAWLKRYPNTVQFDADYDSKYRWWTVHVWSGAAGEVATGRVDDASAAVTEAWTGPQVAWKMARGGPGAFGGEKINSPEIWLAFCAVFLLGLADLRRPWSIRNLDLLALLSFTVSLWYFNHGDIFTSVPVAYPPLVYLLLRAVWIAVRGVGRRVRPVWPVWVLVGATVFLVGFRIGLNLEDSNVIDVGYAGVIGADRIAHGSSPYGHFPVEDGLKPCGPADADGETRERIQANGRCESANEHGDTYGPTVYEAYIPAYLLLGWSGKWDDLPTAHWTTIGFDVLCIVGLGLVGLRFGGRRLGATLAFAWAAYPFTQYASNANSNDMIVPAFLILAFWLVTSAPASGALFAAASWTKFAALVALPLWLSYPERRLGRRQLLFGAGFAVVTLAAFSILLLEPSPLHGARVFWDRTIVPQVNRDSPFSLWDWRQYHARGIPDLHIVQRGLEVLLVVAALAAYFVPRRKSPLQLAALTGALLIGFELVLTHWFYLYIPWFFPFVALAVLAPSGIAAAAEPERQPEADGREVRELVAAG
jgi:hypothetical protein